MRGRTEHKVKTGICALTQTHGKFAKAHIIPKALTRPSIKGAPLMESTKGAGFRRQWSSWFDDQLVTDNGEKILAKIDDDGIKELRRLKLNWSSWGVAKPIFQKIPVSANHHSFRKIAVSDAEKLRKFILSILWRAAASNIEAMSFVKASAEQLELLRKIVLGIQPIEMHHFPTSVIQLTTVGEAHNHSPYNDVKRQPAMLGVSEIEYAIVRLYFDGVIFHIHWNDDDLELSDHMGFLGASDHLLVTGVSYEASFQYENLLINAYESTFGQIKLPEPD